MNWLLWDERLALRLVPRFARNGYTPNEVTAISFVFGLASAAAAFQGALWVAAAGLVIARFLDHVDGALARATRSETRFGAYFDNLTGLATFVAFFMALSFQSGLEVAGLAAAGAAVISRAIEIALSARKQGMIYNCLAQESGVIGNLGVDEAGFLPYWTFPLALLFGEIGVWVWLILGCSTTALYIAALVGYRVREAL